MAEVTFCDVSNSRHIRAAGPCSWELEHKGPVDLKLMQSAVLWHGLLLSPGRNVPVHTKVPFLPNVL